MPFSLKTINFLQVKENDARRKSKRAARNPATAADTGVDIKMEQIDNNNALHDDVDEDEDDDGGFFDDTPVYDEKASFALMNLSRPLLKAIEELKYVHPTPIQVIVANSQKFWPTRAVFRIRIRDPVPF